MQSENIPRFTVGRISDIIKNTLEQTFSIVSIVGEVSNLSITKKYAFFSLKDTDALIRCVIWNPKTLEISEGKEIVATGRITTYKQGSYYQFTVYSVENSGEGNIAKEFAELKEKLQKEGLFEDRHKKIIPKYTQRIALICGEGSAAYSDIIKILESTIITHTYFFPVKVQGKACADSVISAVAMAQKLPVQAIIIARGGGSAEDLHEFNNENLVRAVFASKIPIISAIGHEIDFTILDFIADLRAPTPTAAAKLVSIQKEEALAQIQNTHRIIQQKVKFEIMRTLYHMESLARTIEDGLQNKILHIKYKIDAYQEKLSKKVFINIVQNKMHELLLLETSIKSFNPQNILQKGFALLSCNGKFESNPEKLPNKFKITTKYGAFNVKKED